MSRRVAKNSLREKTHLRAVPSTVIGSTHRTKPSSYDGALSIQDIIAETSWLFKKLLIFMGSHGTGSLAVRQISGFGGFLFTSSDCKFSSHSCNGKQQTQPFHNNAYSDQLRNVGSNNCRMQNHNNSKNQRHDCKNNCRRV